MNSQYAVFVYLSGCLISKTSELISLKFGVTEIYTQLVYCCPQCYDTFVISEVVIAMLMKCPVFGYDIM